MVLRLRAQRRRLRTGMPTRSPSHVGTYTLILARDGEVSAEADAMLLRNAERVLGLRNGALLRDDGMSSREFRFVEGIDEATANALAQEAIKAGFTPRVRDRLGIKWSNQQSSRFYIRGFGAVAVLLGIQAVATWGLVTLGSPGGFVAPLLIGVLTMLAVFPMARLALTAVELPLIVPRHLTHEGSEQTVCPPIAEAEQTLDDLSAAIDTEVPSTALPAFQETLSSLRQLLEALEAEHAALPAPSVGIAALEGRVAVLEQRDAPDSKELATLRSSLAVEGAEADRVEARRVAIAAEAMEIRRVARSALAATREVAHRDDAVERLRREAEALRRAKLASQHG